MAYTSPINQKWQPVGCSASRMSLRRPRYRPDIPNIVGQPQYDQLHYSSKLARCTHTHTHTHTHTTFYTSLYFSGTARVSWYQKLHFAIFWIFWCKMKITGRCTNSPDGLPPHPD